MGRPAGRPHPGRSQRRRILVQPRAAQVRVHQQHSPADLRQRDGQVGWRRWSFPPRARGFDDGKRPARRRRADSRGRQGGAETIGKTPNPVIPGREFHSATAGAVQQPREPALLALGWRPVRAGSGKLRPAPASATSDQPARRPPHKRTQRLSPQMCTPTFKGRSA